MDQLFFINFVASVIDCILVHHKYQILSKNISKQFLNSALGDSFGHITRQPEKKTSLKLENLYKGLAAYGNLQSIVYLSALNWIVFGSGNSNSLSHGHYIVYAPVWVNVSLQTI